MKGIYTRNEAILKSIVNYQYISQKRKKEEYSSVSGHLHLGSDDLKPFSFLFCSSLIIFIKIYKLYKIDVNDDSVIFRRHEPERI